MLRITVVKHWEYRVMHDLLIRLVTWADKSWILPQTWDLFRYIQSCWRVATISFNTNEDAFENVSLRARGNNRARPHRNCLRRKCWRGTHTLEHPESNCFQKVRRSYARLFTRDSALARVSGRNAKDDLLVRQAPRHARVRLFLRTIYARRPMGNTRRSAGAFCKGLRTVDQIDSKELILPLVLVD